MVLDTLMQAEKYYGLSEGIRKGLEYLQKTDFEQVQDGVHELEGKDIFVSITSYQTKETARFEAHEEYIDIQYVIAGSGEIVSYALVTTLGERTDAVKEKDIYFYDNADTQATDLYLLEGMFAIFMPQDGHKPGLKIETSKPIRKAVVKVRV